VSDSVRGERAAPARREDDTPGGQTQGGPSWLRGRPASVIRALFAVAVAAVIALYLARSWDTLSGYDWRLSFWPALAATVCFAVFYLLSGLFWWAILDACGLRSGKLRAVATWGQSVLARYLPGNVFMFAGRLWMSVRQGLEPDRVTAAMVYEQVLSVAGALLTAALLFPFWEYERALTAWSLIAVPLLVALLHPRVFAPLAALVLRIAHRPPLRQVITFRRVCLLLAWSVGLWLLVGVGAWLTAVALTGAGADALPQVVAAFALAFVAGMVAFFVPSGIGVREGVLAAATVATLPGSAVAFAWALLVRFWVTLVELGFVAVVTLVDRRTRSRKPGAERPDD
jgi:glycosyltransferase 2 family protein